MISAFACHPNGRSELGSGEDLLGWNIIKQIGRFHRVWVLAHPLNREGIETALEEEPLSNIQFHYINLPHCLRFMLRLPIGIQLYAYLWQIRAYFTARRLHRRCNFQVFHHVTYANDWMASFIGALLPIPFIRGPGGGAHRTPKPLRSEYSIKGRLWEHFRRFGQWVLRHDPFFLMGQSKASAILVCNQEALSAIPKKWRCKALLFPVNGVSSKDLALIDSSLRREKEDEKFRILTAGKLIRLKGFTLAIKAFKSFVSNNSEAELEIVGNGPDQSPLETLVHQLDLEKQIHFQGWLPREKLLKKMKSCDIFLFPSLRDGGGAVVIEAMAAGRPVVCLDIGGPGLHITEECGVKVSPHSPERVVQNISQALERLFSNQQLRTKLGKKARERVEQCYHWDRLGERLMKIYEKVLSYENNRSSTKER